MLRPFLPLLAFLIMSEAAGAVTAAWKLPVEVFAPGYRQEGAPVPDPSQPKPGKAKLAKPPGDSAFFLPGDELWDISKEVETRARLGDGGAKHKWAGEWMVWNARSHMIVARGSAVDIMMMDAMLDRSVLPMLVRTKLELVKGSDRTVHELSLLSASGETAIGKAEGVEAKIHGVNAEEIGGRTAQDIDVRWNDGELKAEVSVHLDLDDFRTRIARFGTGEDQWELFASGGLAYSHGVLVSEVRWKEQEGKLELWPEEWTGEVVSVPLGEELQIAIFKVRPDLIKLLGGGDDGELLDQLPDPFGDETKRVEIWTKPVPKEFSRWLDGELADLRSLLQQNGVKLDHPRASVGYDQSLKRLFVISSPMDIQLTEMIVGGIGCVLSTRVWAETDAASGNWGLACRSGEESRIELSMGERRAGFSIRPDFSEDPLRIDTAYKLDLLAGGSVGGRFEARSQFLDAVPSEVGSYRSPEGKGTKAILTIDAGY